MARDLYDNPYPTALYFVLILTTLICVYTAWIGSIAVRLYFYKGALGPEPERFAILPAHLRVRSPQRGHHRRVTTFPIPAPLKSPARELTRLAQAPRVNIADVDAKELPDPEIRAFFAEQQRISRLPLFVQDDCGDGSDFPDVPFAIKPVEVKQTLLAPSKLVRSASTKHKAHGLKKLDQSEWLVVDAAYEIQHVAREVLLTKTHVECVQVMRDGETACEELLEEIVKFLVSKYPKHFSIKTVHRRRHIRNNVTKEEWSLVRPFDCHPLEVCARLAIEDFNILIKGEFTLQYYLQASATLAPAGWRMRNLIGKPLSHMQESDIYQWDDIPDILPLTSTSTPLSRTALYIQTHPDARPLAHLLFIQEPKDFFPGNLSTLLPQHIIVRHEHQVFKRLPKCGAVVFSTRTEVKKLTDLDGEERRDLVREIRSWDGEVALRKGVELWQKAVVAWCERKTRMADGGTVECVGEYGNGSC